jgi:para-nitrobenzyl esterase
MPGNIPNESMGESAVGGDIDIKTERVADRRRPPVVETASGRVAGVTSGGVHVFKGIPHRSSTAGANRFMPPSKPEPWAGVREAIVYAGRSPQAAAAGPGRPELATVWGAVDTLPVGEDCLTLHVWTPALDNSKRPVMVWLHEARSRTVRRIRRATTGTNLVRRNDVVVVAVNHRLNIFGHLDLSGIGDERFASSGNVGILDLVAALEWVREQRSLHGRPMPPGGARRCSSMTSAASWMIPTARCGLSGARSRTPDAGRVSNSAALFATAYPWEICEAQGRRQVGTAPG